MLEHLMKNNPWEELGEIPEGPSLLWRDPTLEQGRSVGSPPPEEGAAETM